MRKFSLAVLALFMAVAVSAQPSATTLLAGVLDKIEGLNPYKVEIQVTYGSGVIAGYYEVDGTKYYISVDQQEVYGDDDIKYEIYNGRKEVVIDNVSQEYNGNILNNPATAFANLRNHYTPKIASSNEYFTIVELKQNIGDVTDSEVIELVVDNQSGLPSSVIYKLGDEVVQISIIKMDKLTSPITSYDTAQYSDYEIIDFR